jgi:nucleotide-binding universal stress UspA family protein
MLRVLVPSDGSPNAQYGVRHVVSEFMKNRDLEIHVLNVQRPFSRYVSRSAGRRARTEFHHEQAEKALKPALRALDGAGIPYTVHSEVGDKADCIAEAARWLQCDRIVMGTARKSSLVRLFEDSVTNKVIERTTVPVEVIAGDAVSPLERVGVPAGVGAGLLALWIARD